MQLNNKETEFIKKKKNNKETEALKLAQTNMVKF